MSLGVSLTICPVILLNGECSGRGLRWIGLFSGGANGGRIGSPPTRCYDQTYLWIRSHPNRMAHAERLKILLKSVHAAISKH